MDKYDKVKVKGQFDGTVTYIHPDKSVVKVEVNGATSVFPYGSWDVEPVNADPSWAAARQNLVQQGFSHNYWILIESQTRDEFEPDLMIWSPSITGNFNPPNRQSYLNIKGLKENDMVFHVLNGCVVGVSQVIEVTKTPCKCPYPSTSKYHGMPGVSVNAKWMLIYPFISLHDPNIQSDPNIQYDPNIQSTIKQYYFDKNKPTDKNEKAHLSAFQYDGELWQGAYLHRLERPIAKVIINNIQDKKLAALLPQVK